MRGWLLALLLLAPPALAQTGAPRVMGVVELPGLFGETEPAGPPGQRPPAAAQPLRLYARPQSGAPLLMELTEPSRVTSKEFGHEALGAQVYERRDGWSLIRVSLPQGGNVLGWVAPAQQGRFHPLEALLRQGRAYLTGEWSGELHALPGAPGLPVRLDAEAPINVDVLEARTHQGGLWLRIGLLADDPCETARPAVRAQGWVPAHSRDGEPVAWFYSRGC